MGGQGKVSRANRLMAEEIGLPQVTNYKGWGGGGWGETSSGLINWYRGYDYTSTNKLILTDKGKIYPYLNTTKHNQMWNVCTSLLIIWIY